MIEAQELLRHEMPERAGVQDLASYSQPNAVAVANALTCAPHLAGLCSSSPTLGQTGDDEFCDKWSPWAHPINEDLIVTPGLEAARRRSLRGVEVTSHG